MIQNKTKGIQTRLDMSKFLYIILVLLRLGLAEGVQKPSLPIEDDPIRIPLFLHELPRSLRTQKSSLPIGDDPTVSMA